LSVLSIFFEQTFWYYYFAQLFSAYSFCFVIFWQKEIGANAVLKMLVALTTSVNITKNLAFYQYPLHMKNTNRYKNCRKVANNTYVRKSVGKFDCRCFLHLNEMI